MRLFWVFLVAFSVSCSAFSFESLRINAEIVDGRVLENIAATVVNDGNKTISGGVFSIPADAVVLGVSDDYGELDFSVSQGVSLELFYNLSVPILPGEKRTVVFSLETSRPLQDKGEYSEFLTIFTPPFRVEDFEFYLSLPEGAELFSPSGKSEYLVSPDAEIRKRGEKTWIVWRLGVVEGQQITPFLVRYSSKPGESFPFVYLFLALAMFAVGYLSRKPVSVFLEKRRQGKMLENISVLNKKHREVLKIVIENQVVSQNEIRRRLGLSKSSLSKILAKYEKRGLVVCERWGKVNKWSVGPRLKFPKLEEKEEPGEDLGEKSSF